MSPLNIEHLSSAHSGQHFPYKDIYIRRLYSEGFFSYFMVTVFFINAHLRFFYIVALYGRCSLTACACCGRSDL